MILITVGTTSFPFFRMSSVFFYCLANRKRNEKIIYQYGNLKIENKSANVFLTPYLSFYDLQNFIKKARVVISHGGPATIYQCHINNKLPYVLPREKVYGEHVNNHQLEFCNFLKKEGRIKIISDQPDLVFNRTNLIRRKLNKKPVNIIKFLFKQTYK